MLKRATFIGVLLVLLGGGTASAVRLGFGNLTMDIGGGFTPKTLPKNRDTPISIYGHARIRTKDGTQPPILKRLAIEYDRHGHVETRGLPKCTVAKLEHTDVKTARRTCPGAIVGKGFGEARIEFPDSMPIPAKSPLTIFNGPRKKGDPTVIAHAYLTQPVPTTFTVPVRIQRIKKGRYGYRTEAKIPQIASGYGAPVYGRLTINRRWRFRGKKLSFVNARCVGGRLQARGFFYFDDSTELQGSVFNRCKVKKQKRGRK